MELYLQWAVVGAIVLAALIHIIVRVRNRRRGIGNDCGCGSCAGCGLKDHCNNKKE